MITSSRSSRRLLCIVASAGALLSLQAPADAALVFDYSSFAGACGSSLTCIGSTTVSGTALRLTPATTTQAGAGYSTTAITLGSNATFSTTFKFQITNPVGIDPADGMTFVLASNATGLGSPGAGLGYQGVANSVAIEFDTFDNGPPDISSNHVAIDTNGELTNTAAANPYGVSYCVLPSSYASFGCMSNGDVWTATIGYDGTNLTVQVQDGSAAPQTLINAFPIDIASLLGTTTAYVGFTSSTGSGGENHDILSWQLANDVTLAPSGVPEPAPLTLLGVGLVALVASRRRR